jgi:hypothetical protein
MTKTLYWVRSYADCLGFKHKYNNLGNGAPVMVMSAMQHPTDNSKAIKALQGDKPVTVVADRRSATGWQVTSNEIDVVFADDFDADGPVRRNAESRIRPSRAFSDTAAPLVAQIPEEDDGGE